MAAALGLGLRPGDLALSLGTSGTAFTVSNEPWADPTGTVAGFADATGHYLPLVCTMNATKVTDAVARLLGLDHAHFDDLALERPPGRVDWYWCRTSTAKGHRTVPTRPAPSRACAPTWTPQAGAGRGRRRGLQPPRRGRCARAFGDGKPSIPDRRRSPQPGLPARRGGSRAPRRGAIRRRTRRRGAAVQAAAVHLGCGFAPLAEAWDLGRGESSNPTTRSTARPSARRTPPLRTCGPMTYSNPVIPGFYPDPSVCRAGDEYFLATSSFTYFPGVPVFRSSNLVDWKQIGNALDRPSQLDLSRTRQWSSLGIYAPTIRHRDGRFWVITTNVGSEGALTLLVTSDDAAGPWSDPVPVEVPGIDPDIAWDGDGTCWVHFSGLGGIARCRIEPTTGRVLEGPDVTWSGTGLQYPEAPHLFERQGTWYLLIAEGGTERGHCVSWPRAFTARTVGVRAATPSSATGARTGRFRTPGTPTWSRQPTGPGGWFCSGCDPADVPPLSRPGSRDVPRSGGMDRRMARDRRGRSWRMADHLDPSSGGGAPTATTSTHPSSR